MLTAEVVLLAVLNALVMAELFALTYKLVSVEVVVGKLRRLIVEVGEAIESEKAESKARIEKINGTQGQKRIFYTEGDS